VGGIACANLVFLVSAICLYIGYWHDRKRGIPHPWDYKPKR
jgi:hypothetical protein